MLKQGYRTMRDNVNPRPKPIAALIGSKAKAALVNQLMNIFETRPERAIALGQAIVRAWPSFKEL